MNNGDWFPEDHLSEEDEWSYEDQMAAVEGARMIAALMEEKGAATFGDLARMLEEEKGE